MQKKICNINKKLYQNKRRFKEIGFLPPPKRKPGFLISHRASYEQASQPETKSKSKASTIATSASTLTVLPQLHSGWGETCVWVKREIKETSVLTIWACYHSSFKYRSAGSKSIFSPERNLLKAWSIFRGLRDRL